MDLAQEEAKDLGAGVAALTFAETGAGLSSGDLEQLSAQLRAALADKAIVGIVVSLRGGHSLPLDMAAPVAALCLQMETSRKPVIACLEGPVGGAIWALALAAGYRFAVPSAQAVMPEARFGLIPGAGTTQRLPRLVGAAQAIGMMLRTRPEPAADLLAMGALDRVIDGDLAEAARHELLSGLSPRRTRDVAQGFRDPVRYLAEVRAFAERVSADQLDVSRNLVKTVEAALVLPFAAGLAFEAVTLEDLALAPETRAVRHAIRCERSVREGLRAVLGRARRTGAKPLARLGFWSLRPERSELLVLALSKGFEVVVAGSEADNQVELLNRVATLHETLVAQKAMTPEARDADWARLQISNSPMALATCDLILTSAGDTPEGRIPIVGLTHGLGARAALMAPYGKSDHAEFSLPQTPEAPPESGPETALLAEFCQKMGWRLQAVGPDGFIAAHLRSAHRALVTQLGTLGFKGPQITGGLSSVGLGAVQTGGKRKVTGAEYDIGQMALAAMANEGLWLLKSGLARSPLEIDAAALSSGLLPRWMGGPMYQADQRGFILLRSDVARLGGAGRMAACDLLDLMIEKGTRFYPDGQTA